MPFPKPTDDEKQSEFISRCMGTDAMNSEYPDREQRAAVCYGQWRKTKGKSLDKDTRLEMPSPEPKLEIGGKAEDAGWLEGYASVFDVVDAQNDVVKSGAFAKSIKERVAAGKVKLMARHMMHGGDTLEIVGTITEAKEDKHGLWIHAEFASTATAQEVRQLVAEGHVAGLSIGYIPVDWKYTEVDGKEVAELHEVKLMEVTITALPANEYAVITAAKAVGDKAQAIQRDVGAPPEAKGGRALSAEDRSRIESTLAELHESAGKLEALLTEAEPDSTQRVAAHSAYVEVKRRRLALQRLALGAEALTQEKDADR